MSDWKKYRLGDFIDVKHGYAFKGNFITDEPNNNILVTPGNFHIGGGFKETKFKYYNSDLFPIDYVLKEGDIVITMTDLSKESDTLGYSAKIPKINGVKLLHNQRVGLVKFISKNADKEFLYWLMRTRDYQSFIVGGASGTSIMHTSPSRIKEFQFYLPPLPEQKSIASILSSLDDKIDLLNRQNATLERMAETLFRQWFVEEVKEEWVIGKVSDLIKILSGYAFKSSSFVESGKYRLITIKGVQDGYLELNNADKIEVVPDRMPDFCRLEIGDILLSLTGNVGRCCLVDTTDLLLNQRVAKLHPINERDRAYTYFLFRQPQIKQLLEEMGKGTAQSNLSPVETSNMELIIPDEEKLYAFSTMATPWLDKLLFNKKSIKTLTSLRDTLLPKLMSGEVRVEV